MYWRVLALITRCRTEELGHIVKQCDTCPKTYWQGRSCGNRHCPNCQNDKSALWLAKWMAGLLPVQYYLVTFTAPAALRMVVRANGRACYGALFDCGAQTMFELASGKRFIGSDRMGFFGALHTWGRDFTGLRPAELPKVALAPSADTNSHVASYSIPCPVGSNGFDITAGRHPTAS